MRKNLLTILPIVLVSFISNAQVVKQQLGSTYYDLQTNNSIQRRVVVNPTNKNIAVCFTGSKIKGDINFLDRGTGYAYWNGSTWKNSANGSFSPPYDTFYPRIEDKRVGWPNPVFTSTSESVFSHISDGGFNGLYRAYRNTPGSGAWSYQTVTTGAETWPRVASSGNKIVIISSYYQTSFNGVTGGLMFMKSSDGGATWSSPDSIKGAIGINAGNYSAIGGDNYHVDIKGDTIAILLGIYDITLYKSTDFGNTWSRKSFFPTQNNIDKALPLVRGDRSDGTYSVLIDNSGKIHCFWGRQISFATDGTANGYSIDIERAGIMYWNEGMGSNEPIVIPGTDFIRESSKGAMVASERFNRTNKDGNSINYVGTGSGYNVSTTTWPSTGVDAAGNIYMTYAYNRGKIDTSNTGISIDSDPTGYNLYDIYAMKSVDGGANWIGPLNISSTTIGESTYPSMARYVDDSLYVVWQEDSMYGNAVITTSGGANGTGSQAGGPIYTRNKAMFAKAAVNAIVTPTTDITPPVLMFKNSYLAALEKKGLTNAFVVMFKGCPTDTITGAVISKTKKFLLDNIVEFHDNKNGFDTNYLFTDSLQFVQLNTPGFYIVKIWAKDAAGNLSQSGGNFRDTLAIGIQVLDDNEAPVITPLGNNPYYVYLNTSYSDPGADVKDNNPCSGTSYTKTGTVDVTTIGTNTITYNAVDNNSNNGTATRTVIVGIEPTAVITQESLVGNRLRAKGNTSQNLIAEMSKNTFKWYLKKTGSTSPLNGTISSKDTLGYTIPSTVTAFDSVCLEVYNDFNTTFGKANSKTCKYLKYTGNNVSISTANNMNNIEIYPNPNNGSFNIKINGAKSNTARVTVTDLVGRKVVESEYKLSNGTIPFSSTELNKGTYFVTTEIDGHIYLNKVEVK